MDNDLLRALLATPDATDAIVRRALAHLVEGDPTCSPARLKECVDRVRQALWVNLEAYLAAEQVLTKKLARAMEERDVLRRELFGARAEHEVLRGRFELHRDALERGRQRLAAGDSTGAYDILAGITTRELVEEVCHA